MENNFLFCFYRVDRCIFLHCVNTTTRCLQKHKNCELKIKFAMYFKRKRTFISISSLAWKKSLTMTPKSRVVWMRKAIPSNHLDSSITVINTTSPMIRVTFTIKPLIRVISAINWSKLIFTSNWSIRVIFTSNK